MKISKSLFTVSAVVAMATFLAPAASAQLMNGSFEDGSGSDATSWMRFGNAYREAIAARTGDHSMKLFGNFASAFNVTGAFQFFDIAEGQSATARGWAQTLSGDQLTGGNEALLKIEYQDASNNVLAASESIKLTANTTPDVYMELVASLGAAPSGTDHGGVYLLFLQQADNAGGSAFFDDVSVEVVPEPMTLGLLALGGLAALRRRKKS